MNTRRSILLLALLAIGCSDAPSAPPAPTISRAKSITVWEGLPHQNMEQQLFKTEKKAKKHIDLHEFLFYEEPLQVSQDDLDVISGVVKETSSYRVHPPNSFKSCGGFHPDFALTWEADGETHAVLICFGCGEVKVYHADEVTLFDMRSETWKGVEELLRKYRKNRPERGAKAA